jgi:hypothetical protein
MIETFLLPHIRNLRNVGRIVGFVQVENLRTEQRKYRRVNNLFLCIYLILLPCLVEYDYASSEMLPEGDSRLLVFPKLIVQNVAMASGLSLKTGNGGKESAAKVVCNDVPLLASVIPDVEKPNQQSAHESDDGAYYWCAYVLIPLPILVAL